MTREVRHRPALVPLVALGVPALAAALLLLLVPLRPGHARAADEPHDADVPVRDISVQQADHAYTVESVRAVVQGDRAFLRVRIFWPSDDGTEPGDLVVPSLSGTVTHDETYGGMTTTCGTGATPPGDEPVELELDCAGALVPDHVVSVELSD